MAAMLLSPREVLWRRRRLPPAHLLLLVVGCLLCQIDHVEAQRATTTTRDPLQCFPGMYFARWFNMCLRCKQGTYKSTIGPGPCLYCSKDTDGRNATTLGDGADSVDDCYFRPYMKSLSPRYGPIAGGTLVNITIAYLTNQTLVRARFNNRVCNNCTRVGISFMCYTPPAPRPMSGSVDVEMMDLRSEYVAYSPYNFAFRPNPLILSVDNFRTIVSGGIQITVRGQHLTSVAYPEMIVTRIYRKANIRRFYSECKVTNNTLMLCPTPKLTEDLFQEEDGILQANQPQTSRRKRGVDNEDSNRGPINGPSLEYFLSFRLDGVLNLTYIRNVSVYKDPKFFKFYGKHSIRYFRRSKESHVAIRGERLDYTVTASNIHVTVGEGTCKVVTLITNLLECLPPTRTPRYGPPGRGPDRSHLVEVKVGNLRFHVGFLKYVDEENNARLVVLGMAIIGGLLFWVVVLFAVVIWWQRRRHNRRKQIRKLSLAANKLPLHIGDESSPDSASSRGSSGAADYLFPGNGSSNNSDGTVTTGVPSLDADVENPQMMHIDVWSALEEPLKSKVKECQIDSQRLTLGECIGVGSFGRVFKGEMDAEDGNKIPVAVKTLRGKYWCVTSASDEDRAGLTPGQLPPLRLLGIPSAALWGKGDPNSRIITKYGFTSADELPQFLEEGLVMAGFQHGNILPLYGVAVSDCLPFVVSEYMDRGDLRSYIKSSPQEIVSVDLCLGLSHQVAEGMVYLSQQGFLHRDLAARNCLINSSGVVKIGDFGLSRDLHGQDYYRVGDMGRPLPVKWMSIESLNLGKFSTKSDVWSFGVVMWELLSRGQTPYSSVNNVDLKDYINNENRLSQPSGTPKQVYDIMLSCWHVDPTERPTFEELAARFADVSNVDEGPNKKTISDSEVANSRYPPDGTTKDSSDNIDSQPDNTYVTVGIDSTDVTGLQTKPGVPLSDVFPEVCETADKPDVIVPDTQLII